ncbi:M14 family metallopeptidase [Plantactinospora mayteni]|uniref:Peptidase n=1 Tax=Plantactinospora mayteni TaxID=566021 RepID=A0ABQ4F2A1_9ACTN|nr:M14 family zinc carboxypeptidase [Plantactinospora mayteni]GIH01048.1 peptidase [Plantactinospora mayteni]
MLKTRPPLLYAACVGLVALVGSTAVAPTATATAGPGLAETAVTARAAAIPSPEQHFGFKMGAEGKLAAYPDVLRYLKVVAERSDRVDYETIGRTTMGNEYATVLISAPRNLRRLDRLVEINQKLSDPRNTSPEEARRLAGEGVPFYHLEATIHSSEVGNGQAINDIVHRLATEDSDFTRNVLNNSVIVLVPSQNPDGQHLIIDHFNKTAGTNYRRTYPDLYHKYTGHDDNRDWTMFTQIEAQYRLALEKKYRPAIVHIMHQKGNTGSRIFVPPYGGITSENVPANMSSSVSAIGQHAARALAAAGKTGVGSLDYHIYWTLEQPVGFFPFTGSGVYLTEIASVTDYAYPQVSSDGRPLGPQQARMSLIEPYRSNTWTLADIVDYAKIATYAGMEYTAENGRDLLYDNLYAVPHEYMTEGVPAGSYAFVVNANQRDPYATFEMLQRLEWTQVEIDRATSEFVADDRRYGAGSYVVKMRQPRGNWAHQVLGTDKYPEVRDCGECPVLLPYAEATTSLPLQLGVDVAEIRAPFQASLERVNSVKLPQVTMPPAPGDKGAYLVRPESYGTVQIVSALQDANIPTFRAAKGFGAQGTSYPAGTYVVPATPQARNVLATASARVGLQVTAVARAPRVAGVQLKPQTRVGLFRGIGNMPGGWDMWQFDQYGVNYDVVAAQDFQRKSLNELYDTIVLSHGTSKDDIVKGLDPKQYAEEYSWAYGVGDQGWRKLAQFVRNGGTLLAIGSSVATVQELLNLPITPALPDDEDEFVTGGSLLHQEFDPENPVAWGMPDSWPVWLYDTQAWELTGEGGTVVSNYPAEGEVLASGYLRGAEHIRGAVNTASFPVGKGQVVTYGSEITFRTLPRAQFNLLYNAIYHGPAAEVDATGLQQLRPRFGPDGALAAR